MRKGRCNGWVLLEVLLALVVLGIAAASFAALLHETATVLARAAASEGTMGVAERLVNKYALRTGPELERSVGRWTEDGVGVRISRLSPTLFEVLLVDPGGEVMLETALFRPVYHDNP